MLGKLLKNEFKATSRIFLPLYGLLLLYSLVYRYLLLPHELPGILQTLVQLLSGFLYAAVIAAVVAVSFVMLIRRFSKNLLGDEGYLMHTLPVPASQHIAAKVLVATLWNVLSTLMVVASVVIMTVPIAEWGALPGTIWRTLRQVLTPLGIDPASMVTVVLVLLLVALVEKTLWLYAAMSLGQRSARHKTGTAIGVGAALYIGEQLVNALAIWSADRMGLLAVTATGEVAFAMRLLWYAVGSMAVFGVLYAIVSHRMLKRQLNLP